MNRANHQSIMASIAAQGLLFALFCMAAMAHADDGGTKQGRILFANRCSTCHTSQLGAGHGLGPNLYGVLGRQVAHAEHFTYSDALRAMHDEVWSEERLSAFLAAPQSAAPGTTMAFPGMSSEEDRRQLLRYLKELGGH